MANTSRPFEALATRWRTDVFFRARLKLAGLYMLVIFAVIALFSVTLYFNISGDIRESVSHSLREGIDPDRFFEDREDHILSILLVVDALILAVSSAAAYFFAGYTLKPIDRMLRAQERFAADAAHELRTPLAVIRSQIEVLLRSPESLSPRVRTDLTSVLEEATSLAGVTSDLLLAARQDVMTRRQPLSAVPVADAAGEVIHALRKIAAHDQVTIELEIEPGLRVFAAQEGLRRIFTNLIENALRYTSAQGTVRITAAKDEARSVRIAIEDDGSGIAREDLAHVFERFYKADNARKGQGTGLGLSIVQELVESYGGRIRIHSELGKGTTVTIHLQRA